MASPDTERVGGERLKSPERFVRNSLGGFCGRGARMRKGQRGRAKKAWAGIKQNQIPHACKTRKDGAPQRQDQFTRTQSRLGIYRVGQRAQPQFGQVGASTNGCATRADEGVTAAGHTPHCNPLSERSLSLSMGPLSNRAFVRRSS